jgi:hypothetical protein
MNHKNIWMCWLQGVNHRSLHGLNKLCVNRWIEINKEDWNVNVLSSDSIKDYVPEFFEITLAKKISLTKQSDILRILLLEKYGGVWVDASVYPTAPMSSFVDNLLNDTNFFAYRFFPRSICTKNGNRETSSWFLIADEVNHYLISKWKDAFIKKIQENDCIKYYCFHEVLTEIMDEDPKIQHIINNMVQIDQKIPHSAMRDWDKRKESFVYKRPRIQISQK